MKKISRIAIVIMLGFFTSIATAQTNSTPTDGGGYSCYDYNVGSLEGACDTYDYGSRNLDVIIQRSGVATVHMSTTLVIASKNEN